jgi:RecA-family ATPase
MLVADLVPDHCTTLLAGDGGVGKSLLMQMACTCVASIDKPFLGRATEHGVAVYVTAEDPENVLHHRQERICKALDVPLDALADRLIIRSMADLDMALFSDGRATELLMTLEAELAPLQPRVLGLDSTTFVFDDDEIKRRSVAKFMREMNAMARRLRCATVLAAHTSRSSDGSSARLASGSTSWVYQARAALRVVAADGGVELSAPKTNYSRSGLEIDLQWNDGVLLAKDTPGGVLASIEQHRDDEMVVAEIKVRWEGDTDPLSKSPRSEGNFLPAYMARMGRMEFKRASAAMYRLLDAGRIAAHGRATCVACALHVRKSEDKCRAPTPFSAAPTDTLSI